MGVGGRVGKYVGDVCPPHRRIVFRGGGGGGCWGVGRWEEEDEKEVREKEGGREGLPEYKKMNIKRAGDENTKTKKNVLPPPPPPRKTY